MFLIQRTRDSKFLMRLDEFNFGDYAWDENPCYAVPVTEAEIPRISREILFPGEYRLVTDSIYWNLSEKFAAMKAEDVRAREAKKKKKAKEK